MSTDAGRRGGRRWGRGFRLVAGWSLFGVGGALLVLPGPGIPLVLGGLALLAREQPWAARWHQGLRERWARVRQHLSG